MLKDVYHGDKVRLAAIEPEQDAELMAAWRRDSEYARLLDSDPVRLWSVGQTKEWLEKQQESDSYAVIEFIIRTFEEDNPIGFAGLYDISWHHGNCWVGIGIGEREQWNKGYGSDAMQIIARYAFEELGLHRLTLNVFSYNTRAIRAYEKVGYKVEGRVPEAVHREGKRWDIIFMGLLREDWIKENSAVQAAAR